MSNGELPAKGVSRIAGLVIINALIFQEVLSSYDGRVKNISILIRDAKRDKKPFAFVFADHWELIVAEIDYYPIFHLASELLLHLPSVGAVDACLLQLANRAQSIVGKKAALRHDLMGRIFHRMLLEAKYLGTYYTSIPAATILLRTALRPKLWSVDWSSLEAIKEFKVGDLACGTGTLLMAAADSIADNAIKSFRPESGDLSKFHKEVHRVLAEEVIHGYDVLPTALHLTAATLAMRAPDVVFEKMNLFSMPLGGTFHRLGSLDFLEGHQLSFDDLFGSSSEVVSSKGKKQTPNAALPMLDLFAINPPFTRSVGGNLLFGSVPEARRVAMQKHLKKMVSRKSLKANITAGLGSVFVALADRYLVEGGRLALVLPKALVNGVAWGPTRQILREKYVLEYVFSSHDPERWNFSESTDLSEVMVVARKIRFGEKIKNAETIYTNFYRNPTNIIEALSVAYQLPKVTPGDLFAKQGASRITLGSEVVAEVVSLPWDFLKKNGSFMWGTAFAQSDLTRVLLGLVSGKLRLPGERKTLNFPVVSLGSLGRLGPDRRDMHDGFSVSKSATSYPCVWGRDADTAANLELSPNAFLVPLAKAQAGRSLRKVEDLWPLASDVLIAERLRLTTQSLLAVRISESVLANMWWTFALVKPSVRKSKALVMWFNSSLGVLTALGCRLETQGAWIAFKKPILEALPVLDVNALKTHVLKELVAGFDSVYESVLLPFPQMATDPVRKEIDQVVAKALKLPDLSPIRTALSREPFVCQKRL